MGSTGSTREPPVEAAPDSGFVLISPSGRRWRLGAEDSRGVPTTVDDARGLADSLRWRLEIHLRADDGI